jgi:PEP-CTERM/exosortase A-associated glycosyltransferase
MSIVQIFDQTYPLVSGYSMRSHYITNSLHKLGVPLSVFSSPIFAYKQNNELIQGVEHIRCVIKGYEKIRRFPIYREAMIVQNIASTLQTHWRKDFQVISAHSSVLNGLAALKAVERHKVPLIYEIRALWEDAAVDQGKTKQGSLRYNLTRKIETDVIKKADQVTVICQGLKDDIVARGISADKITIIENGVDVANFSPQLPDLDIIKRYNLKGYKVFGFVGTFFEFEGLDLLIKAAKEIIHKRRDVKFLFVGGGLEEAKLKKMVDEAELNHHVIFSGRVKHDDVQKFYSVIDVCVYPRISLRITELVTPLKPLEAMALQKLVIGSDVGGIKELVKDGYNGLLFKAGNVNDLAEKCIYALDHSAQMERIAREGRNYVTRERDWVTICEKYFGIFKKLNINFKGQ